MKLPSSLPMKEVAHGHGAKGMAFYSSEDVQGLGVLLDARRKDGRSPFVETFRFKWLPNVVCATYAELCAAVEPLADADVADEKAKWPQMHDAIRERTVQSGYCWLHSGRPATHFGFVQTCWILGCGEAAMLCEECGLSAGDDPQVIHKANVQRKADVAARHPITNEDALAAVMAFSAGLPDLPTSTPEAS